MQGGENIEKRVRVKVGRRSQVNKRKLKVVESRGYGWLAAHFLLGDGVCSPTSSLKQILHFPLGSVP